MELDTVKKYYEDLLILQYRTREKARATIGALVSQTGCNAGTYGKIGFDVVGTPTIQDGVISDITRTNYVVLNGTFDTQDIQALEVKIKFTTGPSFSHTFESVIGCACGTFSFYLTNEGVLRGVYLDDVGTHDNPIASGLETNTTYYAKMLLGDGIAILSISQDGVIWQDTVYSADDQRQLDIDPYYLVACYPFTGSLDLNEFYLKINGEVWAGYTLVNTTLPSMIINGFDLNTAGGKNLDMIGQYIGLKRIVKALIIGTNTNVLNDDQYRLLLKLKLIKNTNFSSTGQLKEALFALFPTSIRLYDNRDMTYDYQLSSVFSNLVNIIVAEDLLPAPMALGYTATVVPSVLDLYGYYDYGGLNNNPNGYSDYTNGFRNKWLSYGDRFISEE